MLVRKIVQGKPAMVAYFSNNFELVDEAKADLIKVVWDDGQTIFGRAAVFKQDSFEESAHPRAGKGQHSGGQFVGKNGPKPAYGSKKPQVPSSGSSPDIGLTGAGLKLASELKDRQADNSAIKRMFALYGLSLEDYDKINALYYKHNILSGGDIAKAIENAWNDPRLGKAMRVFSAWNEWQVVNKKVPKRPTMDLGAIEKQAFAAFEGGNWKDFRRSRQGAEFWDNPRDYIRYLRSRYVEGDTWFYRKGLFDRSVVSTTTNEEGARSGGSHFVPTAAKSFDDMKALGYHLLAGARGLVGVTAGDEGEHIWFKPPVASQDSFEESAHPRAGKGQMTGGEFTAKGAAPKRAFGSKNKMLAAGAAKKAEQQQVLNHYGAKLVRLKETKARAFSGKQVETKIKLSKLETDSLGESIALSYLRSIGFVHARSANTRVNNFPIDIFAGNRAIELKSGQVSNSRKAQQFRITLGQPGKAETELLKRMSPEKRLKHNAAKVTAAVNRKLDIAKEYGMEAATLTVLFNPDTHHADIFMLDGYHKRLGWNSKDLNDGYVGSFLYAQ